jgi:hypothetical protein
LERHRNLQRFGGGGNGGSYGGAMMPGMYANSYPGGGNGRG